VTEPLGRRQQALALVSVTYRNYIVKGATDSLLAKTKSEHTINHH
jgi:hypothetical protein